MEALSTTHSATYEEEQRGFCRNGSQRAESKPVVKTSPVAAFNIENILGIRSSKETEEMATSSPETNEIREDMESQIRPSRNRKNFSKDQRRQLEKLFEDSHYPDAFTREELAKKLGISQSRVQIWFQNRRAKIRRQHDHANHKQPQNVPHHEHHYHQSLLRMMGYSMHQYPQVGHSPGYPHVHPSHAHPQTPLEQHYEQYWRNQQSHHPSRCDWRSRAQYPRYDYSGYQ